AGLESAGYRGWYVLEQDVALSKEPHVGEGPVLDVIRSLEFLSRVEQTIGNAAISF
ncbi:MAG: inosose dehydratase, partial [Chloroflexi bacterium]|nr:inosose dehydratase [Chloroflexota bacterium]